VRAKRTDANHRAVTAAIRAMGFPVKSLHTQGGGVEDLLVGISQRVVTYRARNEYESDEHATRRLWVLVEVKRIERESTGYIRHTPAQREWYAQTEGFPRLVVTSAQDAVDKLRRMTG